MKYKEARGNEEA